MFKDGPDNFVRTWFQSSRETSLTGSKSPYWVVVSQGHDDDFCLCIIQLELIKPKPEFCGVESAICLQQYLLSFYSLVHECVITSENYRLIAQVKVINVNDIKQGPQNASLTYTMSHRPVTLWESSLKRDRLISICSYVLLIRTHIAYTNFTTVRKRFDVVVKHRT